MELRHLRYFVAVAEEGSFTRAARRSHVAQPALSRQIKDLEAEVGVTLFHRTPRGVLLTPAGAAFLVESRQALARAAQAVDSARDAAGQEGSSLRFAHGELYAHVAHVAKLLAAFRDAHAQVRLQVLGQSDARTHDALRERGVNVGCVFVGEWPAAGLEGHRLLDSSATGVLLPASHPLAAKQAVHMAELRDLRWLGSTPERLPRLAETLEAALRERGLVPERAPDLPGASPFIQIAAGGAWALASELMGAPYRDGSTGVVYRPIVEPPIPGWLALVWLPPPTPAVRLLVDLARRMGMTMGDGDDTPARIA